MRKTQRTFAYDWGTGVVAEEAQVRGEYHLPTFQLLEYTEGQAAGEKIVYFMTIKDAKFRKPVTPGDLLQLKVRLEQTRGPVSKFSGVAEVGGKVVSEAKFSAMMVDKPGV